MSSASRSAGSVQGVPGHAFGERRQLPYHCRALPCRCRPGGYTAALARELRQVLPRAGEYSVAGPVVAMWLECEQELMDYRNMVRDEGEMAMVVPRSRRGASAKSSLRRRVGNVGTVGQAPRHCFRTERRLHREMLSCGVPACSSSHHREILAEAMNLWANIALV